MENHQKQYSYHLKDIMIKFGLILSFFVLIDIAMPDSENGRIIGHFLQIASVAGVAFIDKSQRRQVFHQSDWRKCFITTAVIALYYVLIYLHQYKDRPISILNKMSAKIHITEEHLFLVFLFLIFCAILPSVYVIVMYVTGNLKMLFLKGNRYSDIIWHIVPAFCGMLAVACEGYYFFSSSIWFDETFSMALVQHSSSDIMLLTGQDVHPPLYYLMLKLWLDLVRHLHIQITALIAARMFSGIPYVILFAIGLVQWAKGNDMACFFLCSFFMPNMLEYGVEVRMYSWAMLWVLAAFYEGRKIWRNNGKITNWVFLTLFSLASIYTHYYCGICIALIYLALFYKMANHSGLFREMQAVGRYWCSVLALVVGYLPWLKILFSTLASVSSRTWPQAISASSILDNLWCLFGIYGTICIVLPVGLMNRRRDSEARYQGGKITLLDAIGYILPFLLMLTGIIISVIYTPVWSVRYAVVGLGVMWFSFAEAASAQRTLVQHRIMLLMILIGSMNLFVFVRHESEDKKTAEAFETTIKQYDSDTVLWTCDPNTAYILTTAYDRKCILVGEIGNYLETVYDKNLVVKPNADLLQLVADQNTLQYVEPD